MDSQKQLRKLVEDLVRPCTTLSPRPVEDALPAAATKFGGVPYAEAGERWPVCGGCGGGLSFICQWNMAECAHVPGATGLYAFYYCHGCGSWGDLPSDLKDAWAVRHYPSPQPGRAAALEDSSPTDARTVECSCVLAEEPSLPDWDGVGEVAPRIVELSGALDEAEPWEPYSEIAEGLLGGEPDYRTQVGGYPRFVQNADFPECPDCGERMALLAQIDSEEEAGIMWGDSGSVYLFGCGRHPAQVQMRLQCF